MIKARLGRRPVTSRMGPHSQLDQQSPPELWGRLIYEAFQLPHVVEGRSQVSPLASRALLFDDMTEPRLPETSLASRPPLEPAHLHGVRDTSIHLCLPRVRAAEICKLGWGEPHRHAEYDTEIMVYGPRDYEELELVLGVLGESVNFARAVGT